MPSSHHRSPGVARADRAAAAASSGSRRAAPGPPFEPLARRHSREGRISSLQHKYSVHFHLRLLADAEKYDRVVDCGGLENVGIGYTKTVIFSRPHASHV